MKQVLAQFQKTDLQTISGLAFKDRREAKYIVRKEDLDSLLVLWSNEYAVLEIGGLSVMSYLSAYLDTPTFKFYHDHQRGVLRRSKVRVRSYLNTGVSFIEVKKKDGRGRTLKWRRKFEQDDVAVNEEMLEELKHLIQQPAELLPSLDVRFERATLANLSKKERITIDQNLIFTSKGKSYTLNSIAIIEVKQETYDLHSPSHQFLRKLNYRPSGFSKYCFGVARLHRSLKQNLLKPKFQMIQKLSKSYGTV